MRTPIVHAALLLSCFLATPRTAWGDETNVTSKVTSVGLFKNGLAVVERTIDVDGPGVYRIEDMPNPVHGTFFVESVTPVVARSTVKLVDSPLDLQSGILQDQLAGRSVAVTLKDQPAPVEGTVATAEPSDKQSWSRRYENSRYDEWGRWITPVPPGRFLIVEQKNGRTLVDQASITTIRIDGANAKVKIRKPVLQLTLPEGAPKQTIRLSYLTKGLAWAPAYRVDLLDDTKLTITQNAVLKNELMDLKDVEVFLISGYPSIDFGHVDSPLSLQQTWATFFQQLSQPASERRGGRGVVQQQAIMMNSVGHDGDGATAVAPPNESIDIHYESIGPQTLAAGDAISMNVAIGEAGYERIVEWVVADTRTADGRYIQEYQRQQDPEKYDDSAWDAVKFKNPLPFAMTTAPASFMRDGKFLGQQTSKWVNKDEQNTLRITKALSVRTRASEKEDPANDRQLVYIGGNDYRQVSVTGELNIRNYRKSDIQVSIKRQFSGDLTQADEKPEVSLREEGAWSVNRRNELTWTLTLKAGEEKSLKYRYNVLVDN